MVKSTPRKRVRKPATEPAADLPPVDAPGPDLSYITLQLRALAVPCDSINIDPSNARTHNDANLSALRGSFRTFGQLKAIVVNRRTNNVEAGNGGLLVARELGWSHIAAVFVDHDPTQAATFAIADNRISDLSFFDDDALALLLPQLDRECAELAEMIEAMEAERASPVAASPAEKIDAGDAPEDSFDILFKAPYPWFGGKSRVAGMVWKKFGDIKGYIEPFFGSGAVMLNRPQPFEGTETINDFDGLVANFWRAVKADPDKVAEFADWPVNENDLHGRHAWLVARKDTLQAKLEGDPDYFDAKIAGWWVWGMACWIGSGFCSGDGPWQIVEAEDGSRQLVHLGNAGRGVSRKRVHLGNAGQGVNRQLVHLSDAGQGVSRKRVHLGNAGQGNPGLGERGLLAWMRALSERFSRVRVCCGDWTRVCGGSGGDALHHFFATGEPVGVFLDPPYADTADRESDLYRQDSLTVAHAVREWAIANGDDPRLRIALCGYENEHVMPASWKCVSWKAQGGMGNVGDDADANSKANAFRERLWFSPHCINS